VFQISNWFYTSSCLTAAAILAAAVSAAAAADFVARSQSDLTVELLSQLSARNGNDRNVVFSPSSVFYGVAMLYAGMGGKTRREVARAMSFPPAEEGDFQAAMKNFTAPKESSPLSLANMISFGSGAKPKVGYATAVKEVFHANPYKQDFSNPEKARKSINIWIARRTNKKIKKLMPEGSIDTDTLLVLVNALHFKSDWLEAFENELVGEFTTSDGQELTQVDILENDMTIGFRDVRGTKVAAIPFDAEGFSMVLVLPSENSDPDDVIEAMKSDVITDGDENVMSAVLQAYQLPTSYVTLRMPKFNATMGNELTGLLKNIPGLDAAFSSSADFSRMASGPVKIGKANHKATISVTKDGVEAAAATGFSVTLLSLPPEPELVLDFNRPFLYFIVENKDNKQAIHIAGILNSPREVIR